MNYAALLTTNIVKSFPQETDYIYQPTLGPYAPEIDLKPDVFEVDDQLSIGSCRANATTSVPEDMLKKVGEGRPLSRLFNYWTSRNLIMEQPGIEGSTLRAAVRALKHFGICDEISWPYNLPSVETKPADEAFAEAAQHVVQRYEIIDNRFECPPPPEGMSLDEYRIWVRGLAKEKTIKATKSALNEGLSVAFSCALGEKWFSLAGPWQEHEYPSPAQPGNPFVGNHAMVCIGYDDACQRFLIENSWGPQWGDGGFGGMPYDSLANSLLEGFIIRGFDGIYINDPLQPQWDWIQKMYMGFYNRPADLGGMEYWRDRLIREGFGNVVEAFMTSPEAANLYAPQLMKEANRLTRKG